MIESKVSRTHVGTACKLLLSACVAFSCESGDESSSAAGDSSADSEGSSVRDVSLDSVPENYVAPPPAGRDAGGGAAVSESNVSQLIAATAAQIPPADRFEFLGYVTINTPAQHSAAMQARAATSAALTLAQYQNLTTAESAKNETDSSRMILVSADGRMYRERVNAFPRRPTGREITLLPLLAQASEEPSFLEDDDADQLGHLAEFDAGESPINEDQHSNRPTDDLISAPSDPSTVLWDDTDGRSLSTTSSWPWRAFASLRVPGADSSFCSAGMIAPRVALTSAHCVSSNGVSLSVTELAPGARGPSFSSDFATQYPFGRRFVEWYVWPKGWEGQSAAKYDYAVLILRDINWSPGWISVGKRSGISYTSHHNHQYPGSSQWCNAAPGSANGLCGGFRYTQFENVRTSGDGYFFHEWDAQSGSSGSPMYFYDGSSRRIFGHHEGDVAGYNTATRVMNSTMDKFICPVLEGDFQYKIGAVTHTAQSSFFANPICN